MLESPGALGRTGLDIHILGRVLDGSVWTRFQGQNSNLNFDLEARILASAGLDAKIVVLVWLSFAVWVSVLVSKVWSRSQGFGVV